MLIMFNKSPYTLLALTLITATASADTTWIGAATDAASSDIGDAANWSHGLPTNSDPANDGFIGLVGGSPVTVEMEDRHDLDDRNLTVSGGSTIHIANSLAGSAGFRWENSTLTLNGGHLDVDYTGGAAVIGRDSDPNATILNINAGSTVDFAGTAVYLGRLSQGIVNQNGGSFSVAGTLGIQVLASGAVSGNVYNLSAGTVTATNLVVNDFSKDNSNYFNFTTGSTGTLTIIQSDFDFESFIDAGDIRINDNASSLFSDFKVDSSVGGQTTLSLIPEPGTYALFAGVCALSAIMLRRRERSA